MLTEREFLDDIFDFIGSETLTDEEYDTISLEAELEYDKPTYEALRSVLEGRENVSGQVKKLKAYFCARGADLAGDTVIPTPNSNIFIGSDL